MKRLMYPTMALVAAVSAPGAHAQAEMVWAGTDAANPTFWDQVTENWTGDFTTYFDGDNVTFDDTASTFNVDLQATVAPNAITVDSATGSTYTFTGAGINNQAAPLSLTGDVTLRLNNAATVDVGAVSIAPGATLINDLAGGQTQFFGALTGSGAIVIDQNQIVFTGDGSGYTGSIAVNAGGVANFNTATPTAGLVTVNAGGQVGSFNDAYVNTSAVTLNGGDFFVGNGMAGLTFNGPVTLSADSSVTLNDGEATYASVAPGTHALALTSGGTLSIGTLSGTGNVSVGGAGTVAVTSSYGNTRSLALDGGTLDLTAVGGQTVGNGNTLSGNGGTLVGNAAVQSGGTVSIGGGVSLSGVQNSVTNATYVDADVNTNTTLADGSALPTTPNDVAGDNTWRLRTGFANGSTVFEASGNAGGEDAPMMRTQITGLTPGEEVDVYAYFWTDGQSWHGSAEVSGTVPAGPIQGYETVTADGAPLLPMDGPLGDIPGRVGAGQASIGVAITAGSTGVGGTDANWTSADYFDTGVLIAEGNRSLHQVTLGTFAADGSGIIDVYIDDTAAPDQSDRTWYDGVGYGTTTLLPGFQENIRTLTVDGDLGLSAGSSLILEVLSDNVFDQLVVTGTLSANGSLNVQLGDGTHDFEVGESIDIIDWGALSGSFAGGVSLPSLGGGLAWDTSALLTDGILSIIAGGLPGDTNGDGDVDNSDLQTAIANFTGPQTTPPTFTKTVAQGDNNSDGAVSNIDLQAAISNFTGPIGAAPVPEPASLALLGLGGLLIARRRRA